MPQIVDDKISLKNGNAMDDVTETEPHTLQNGHPSSEIDNLKHENPTEGVAKGLIPENVKRIIKTAIPFVIHGAIIAYFIYATHFFVGDSCYYDSHTNQCLYKWCTGYGLLLLMFSIAYFIFLLDFVFHLKFVIRFFKSLKPLGKKIVRFGRTRAVTIFWIVLPLIDTAVTLYLLVSDDPGKLRGLLAPACFLLIGFAACTKHSAIPWLIVVNGVFFQFMLGIIAQRWEPGRNSFNCIGDKFSTFLNFTDQGSRFVYGDSLINDGSYAFAVLSMLFLFSLFVSLLYYLGIMQQLILIFGWILDILLGTTICESVVGLSNWFLGPIETPLIIRPYLKVLTRSEIHAIMATCFATTSGTVFFTYLAFGASPIHLMAASVMAAPSALAMAKLFMPETEESKTTTKNFKKVKSEDSSILDAASSGANNAIQIVLTIIAHVIAFVAFVAFVNQIINWFAVLVGQDFIDLEWILSKIFLPVTWAMGAPTPENEYVAIVLAQKVVHNEFSAYKTLTGFIKEGRIQAHSASIAIYAVSGFANPASFGLLIGSLRVLAPSRKEVIVSVAFRAFIIAIMVTFMSGSFMGIILSNEDKESMVRSIIGWENQPEYWPEVL